jgi:fatty acid desaturase
MKYKAKKVLEDEIKENAKEDIDKPLDKRRYKAKNWYKAPTYNSPESSNFKKIVSVAFMLITIVAMILLALSKITWIEFWLTTIFCAVFAWLILPKMK